MSVRKNSAYRCYLLLFSALVVFQQSHADFAKAMACQNHDAPKDCSGVLIGTIDALQAMGSFCPDGNTSYSYLIESWKRWVANNPQSSEAPTLLQMRQVLRDLGLACGK
jgi:hypothetical protein